MEQTNLLLQLMVEAVARGWCDDNGLLSKQIVEISILPEPITKRFTASEEKRQFRTETLIDYDDLKVVIGNATSSGRYSIGLGDDNNARVIGVKDRHVGIEDYVFDKNNNAFVQSEYKLSHQALPLEQSMSPLSFQNMGSEIPSKSTNSRREAKVIMKAAVVEKLSQVIDSIAIDFRGVLCLMEKIESDREKRKIEKKEKEGKINIWDALGLLNIKIKKDAFLKMSLKERAAWILYTPE
ncbi:hypothetical protein ACOSQ2_007249 [Xanthoceras sorbifolium]